MKEELPSILVTDGWETDANDKLVEVVIPSTVDTYQNPTKITFFGDSINWIPTGAGVLQEFDASNMTTWTIGSLFSGFSALTSFKADNLESIVFSGESFKNCSLLNTVSMKGLKSLTKTTYYSPFSGTPNICNLLFDNLETIICQDGSGYALFSAVTSLQVVNLPKFNLVKCIQNNNPAIFSGCTGLQSVTLGSEGHPVPAINSSNFFNGCTQSGLTITIYTTGGATLPGSPWGATNATIVYETA